MKNRRPEIQKSQFNTMAKIMSKKRKISRGPKKNPKTFSLSRSEIRAKAEILSLFKGLLRAYSL